MDKITILKTNVVYKNGEVEYDTAVITDEEIRHQASLCISKEDEYAFLVCWEYIKSRINQQIMEIKNGQVLTAIQECKMHFDGRPTLTIGKSYEVIEVDDEDFGIIDDENDTHYFPIKGLELYFDINQ